MSKAFITGITGTVAPYVKEELINKGYEVHSKHFRVEKEEDLKPLKEYLNDIKPNIIFHLALGPFNYLELLLSYANTHNCTFVYISTVSVFEDNNGGPYYKDTPVTVKNEYGVYKYQCENLVNKHKPDSYIIRIGWQISEIGDSSTNNMFHFIANNLDEDDNIIVSNRFYPSVSFLDETAKAIVRIIETKKPDVYLVNSNEDKSLYDIVSMLNTKFCMNITIHNDSTFKRNDIMIDPRVDVQKLS